MLDICVLDITSTNRSESTVAILLSLMHQDQEYAGWQKSIELDIVKSMIVSSARFYDSFIISEWNHWNIDEQMWVTNEPIIFTFRLDYITNRCWCQSIGCLSYNTRSHWSHCCRLYQSILPMPIRVTSQAMRQWYYCVIKRLPRPQQITLHSWTHYELPMSIW